MFLQITQIFVTSYLVWGIHYASIANCLENGLARTPPMGWMHWQRFRCLTNCTLYPDDCVSEQLFKQMANHIKEDGYMDAGYEYIIVDDCWAEKNRENGLLVADKTRFPTGMKALSDYIHNLGLKFGIYADYGSKTCAGYPGSKDHLETDASTFANWSVDYLKLDACYAGDPKELEEGYRKMGKALNKTGRPIVYSCSWPAYQEPLGIPSDYKSLAEVCNLWRNWDDIEDTWLNVTRIADWFGDNQERIRSFAGPGHWNDPDMLIIGNFGLSLEQSKSQMAIWAILAAPLIMSVDLRNIRTEFKDILINKQVIAINQDPLGIQGERLLKDRKIEVWYRPISPVVDGYNTIAIAFLSKRVDGYPYRFNITMDKLNLTYPHGYYIKDAFDNKEFMQDASQEIIVRVKPSGVVLLVAQPISNPTTDNVTTK